MIWQAEKPGNDVDSIPLYAPGSAERELLLAELERLRSCREEIPLFIGGKRVWEGEILEIRSPADHRLVLGRARLAGEREIGEAVESALRAWKSWSSMPIEILFSKYSHLIPNSFKIGFTMPEFTKALGPESKKRPDLY